MKIKKGDYVDCKGFSEIQRKAVVAKFKKLGYLTWCAPKRQHIGILPEVQKNKITLSALMFCDQPDDVTHCYYEDGKLYYFNSDEHIDPDFLICTREPEESKDWYKKGELPPVGEVVEANVPTADTFEWKACEVVYHTKKEHANRHRVLCVFEYDHGTVETFWASNFRPIKSERDKLIEAAQAVSGLRARDGAREVAQNFVDAGWRPTDESSR